MIIFRNENIMKLLKSKYFDVKPLYHTWKSRAYLTPEGKYQIIWF